MAHCIVKLNETRQKDKQKRWQRIAEEAAKQCGRDDIPEITLPLDIAALSAAYQDARFVVPWEKETAPLHQVCQSVSVGDVVICIGPEGGFADEEITFLTKHVPWCRTVSLGPRILRAETASLAALAIIMYERGFN